MRATASKAALLGKCQAWARGDAEWHEGPRDEDSERGVRLHSLGESIIKIEDWPPGYEPEGDELVMARHLGSWIFNNRKPSWNSEVAFAWLPVLDVGRVIVLEKHRGYAGVALEGEMCGTADIVSVEGDTVHIYDFKTGWDIQYAPQQLRALALFAARAYGLERAAIHCVHVQATGVTVTGSSEEEGILDMFDLQAIAGELAELTGAIETSTPNPGDHCAELRCPAIAMCPATATTADEVEQLIPAAALVRHEPMALTFRDADHCAAVLARKRALDKALEQIGEAVDAFVGDKEHPLRAGGTLKQTYRNMPRTPAGAYEALARRLGATDEDIALCVRVVRENAGIKVVKPKAVKASRKRAA
jgi:hypothetical protein